MFGVYVVKIGMVFQNPDNQFVGATVEDDVAFGLENQGLSRQEMKKESGGSSGFSLACWTLKRESQRVYRVVKSNV